MSNADYLELSKTHAGRSPVALDCAKAFIFGGIMCALAQALTDVLYNAGLSRDTAATVTVVAFVLLGGLLTALHIYDNIAKHAGAGIVVPITGFANAVVSPAMEFRSEGFILGMAAKMFAVAGPVIVYGVTASVIYGLIYLFVKAVF